MANPSGSNTPRERRGVIPRQGFRLPNGVHGVVEEGDGEILLTIEGDGLGEVVAHRIGKRLFIHIEQGD
jgi:hypothetical protein